MSSAAGTSCVFSASDDDNRRYPAERSSNAHLLKEDGNVMTGPRRTAAERRALRDECAELNPCITNSDLLARVLEFPDSDIPRINYAHWLLSHTGKTSLEQEARQWGHFIEQEIAFARGRLTSRPEPPRPSAGRELIEHGFFHAELQDFRYSRGFTEHVSVMAEVFVDAAEELLSLAPLRMLSVRDLARAPHIALAPQLSQIRAVVLLDDAIDDEVLEAWIESPSTTGIKYFEFDPTGVTDDAIARLVTSPAWNNLSVLRLRTKINPGWQEAVASSEDVYKITGLSGSRGRFVDLRDTPRKVPMHPGLRVAAVEAKVGYRSCLHPESTYDYYAPSIVHVIDYPSIDNPAPDSVDYGPLPSLIQRAREGRCPYCGHDKFYRVEHTALYGSPFEVFMTTDDCRLCRSSWDIGTWPERRSVHVSNIIPSHLYNTQDDYDQ